MSNIIFSGTNVSEAAQRIMQDRGKSFYRYQYETCKSNGPSHNEKFTDTDKELDGTGDGKWITDQIEPTCEHANKKGGACSCNQIREYLIVAFWTYDEEEDTIKMHREYVIDKPFAPQNNVRPLNISEQAECAFWFEVNNNLELVYCEVSLLNDGLPSRTALRMN